MPRTTGDSATTELSPGSVANVHIQSGAVTNDKLADGAVGLSKLADGSIGPTKINENAIENRHIAPASIGKGKIGAAAVEKGNIAAAAVEKGNIALSAVEQENIAASAVGGEQIGENSIQARHLDSSVFNMVWFKVPLTNSWRDDGPGLPMNANKVGYFKDPIGIIHLTGIVTGGTSPIILKLPVEDSPENREFHFAFTSDGNVAGIEISPGGDVAIFKMIDNSLFVSLDGISFARKNVVSAT